MEPLKNVDRLSLNQATTDGWTIPEAIEGCVRAEIPWISFWRHKIAETGLAETKRLVKDSGLKVSSICRGGMFPAATAAEREERLDDNRRAIEEAAELNAECLVLVCGPSADKDIVQARQYVAEGTEKLVPFAKSHGVKLGIEPLHPMYAGDRSVIVSLAQALDMAQVHAADEVGVVIDVFHVWWDPDLYNQIKRSEGRILGYHVNDWLVPMPDMLKGRGMMGDGVIELRRIRKAVEEAGYSGPIEVEIFNDRISEMPGDEVLELMKKRYLELV